MLSAQPRNKRLVISPSDQSKRSLRRDRVVPSPGGWQLFIPALVTAGCLVMMLLAPTGPHRGATTAAPVRAAWQATQREHAEYLQQKARADRAEARRLLGHARAAATWINGTLRRAVDDVRPSGHPEAAGRNAPANPDG